LKLEWFISTPVAIQFLHQGGVADLHLLVDRQRLGRRGLCRRKVGGGARLQCQPLGGGHAAGLHRGIGVVELAAGLGQLARRTAAGVHAFCRRYCLLRSLEGSIGRRGSRRACPCGEGHQACCANPDSLHGFHDLHCCLK
jgi:hypothetical protein